MLESSIEKKLKEEVKKVGGLALKFVSPGFNGVPDRLILLAKAKVAFVEVKAPGEEPRKLQKKRHRQLRALGFQVFILDNESQIGGIIDAILTT